jgi:hypothetical protein
MRMVSKDDGKQQDGTKKKKGGEETQKKPGTKNRKEREG